MQSIRSIDEVVDHWLIFKNKWEGVYAFFLYSNEDRQIIKYIREYFTDLHILSGEECLIFLIDKPPNKREKMKDYCKGFTKVVPYDRSKSYKIADFFGISPKAIPCIVFFKNIDETELLVCPLKNSWNEEKLSIKLREVFSAIKIEKEHIYSHYEDGRRKERIWKDLKKYIGKEYIEQKIMGIITHPNTISIGQTIRKIFLNC